MSLEVAITEIKRLLEEKPMFKPAGEAELSNRYENDSLKIGTIAQLSSADQIVLMQEFEDGGIWDENLLKLFSHLIKSRQVWNLQGSYGRMANSLMKDGWLGNDGTILKLPSIRLQRVGEAVNEDKPLFKPAGEDALANRPGPTKKYRQVTSVEQLKTLGKLGLETFISDGPPLFWKHTFMHISHSTDNSGEWYIENYALGKAFKSPESAGLVKAIENGKLWYDRQEFEESYGALINLDRGEAVPESVNEATPRKRKPAPKSMFKPASPEILASREEQAKTDADVRAKARAAQWAGTPDTDLPWEERARRELSMELDVDIEIDETYNNDDRSVMRTVNGNSASNGESAWDVYPNQETAYKAAIERVENDLENEPGMFSQDFLQSYITISDTDRHMIAQEEADSYVSNIEDEDGRILEEAGLDSEHADLQAEIDDLDSEDPSYDMQVASLEQRMGQIVEEATEKVRENRYDEVYDSLSDPVNYFVHETGMYSLDDLMKSSFISIDIEDAAEAAVSSDGVAHYLDGYDNSEVELPSGAVAYGTN